MVPNIKFNKSLILSFLFFLSSLACAGVTKIEIISQESLSDAETDFSYENIQGIVYFSLDPLNPANSEVTDIEHAPRNAQGNVEYSADFKLLRKGTGMQYIDMLVDLCNYRSLRIILFAFT